jgi:hypothetical protein
MQGKQQRIQEIHDKTTAVFDAICELREVIIDFEEKMRDDLTGGVGSTYRKDTPIHTQDVLAHRALNQLSEDLDEENRYFPLRDVKKCVSELSESQEAVGFYTRHLSTESA